MKSSFTFTRLKDIVLKRKRILIIGACIILFIELLDDVLEGDLMTLDLLAKAFFVENLRADWLTPIMESISALATPVSLLVLLLVIVAFAPGKRPGMFCTVNLVLVVLLNVLLKELEKLSANHQVLILSPTAEKKIIIVIAFFIEKFSQRYKEILAQPMTPFPQESDIPKKIPSEIITRRTGAELLNELLTKETLSDKYLYGLTMPHDMPSILLPSLVSVHTLAECAVQKLRTLLAKEEHHDYFMKKLTVSNPGKEMTAKNIFNRFVQNADSLTMFKEPEDSFYFLTQLLFFIRQDYEKVKDYTAEDIGILHAVYILEIIANYYKTRAQENSKKETAFKNLEQHLSKPPYYFTLGTITKFTSSSGVPLLGQYSEEELKNFLHTKTTESLANDLPEILVFKTELDKQPYFIYKNKVMPLIMRLCTDARAAIRETIRKNWFKVLKNFDDLPAI